MIVAVFDPSPLTVCINCSFFNVYISYWRDEDEKARSKNFQTFINIVHSLSAFFAARLGPARNV